MCAYLVQRGADDHEVPEMTVKMQDLTAGTPYIPRLVGLSTKLRLTGRRLSDSDNRLHILIVLPIFSSPEPKAHKASL